MQSVITLQTFNIRDIQEDTARHLNAFWNRMRLERLPDDPPIPFEEEWQGWQNYPPFEDLQVFAIWNPEQTGIIATGEAFTFLTEENQHLLFFEISVAPQQRQQGLGRQLLRLAADLAQEKGKRLMMTETNDRVLAGEIFAERMGAKAVMHSRTNQLLVEDIDTNLLARWMDNTSGRFDEFELGYWDGIYPEAQIEGVHDLFQIVKDEPKDDMDFEDREITIEQLRQMEQYQIARGVERWTSYAIEKATGRFCGFTEVFWNPNRPTLLNQGFTGVNPDFRGKSLGRLMKATMLERVLRERPQVQKIRTGNANSNRFMLAINNELGFKPYIAWTVWQIDTAKVQEYLS